MHLIGLQVRAMKLEIKLPKPVRAAIRNALQHYVQVPWGSINE